MATRDTIRAKKAKLRPEPPGKAIATAWAGAARLALLMFRIWPERRRQRAQLLELEPRLLRDIGIHRADADREGRKPFWRR